MNKSFRFCPFCKNKLSLTRQQSPKRQVCLNCGWINYRNPLPAAVALAVNDNNELLLIKRNIKPSVGKWALPGGFIEIGETPQSACLRELAEETGLKGELDSLIGTYIQQSYFYGDVLLVAFLVFIDKIRFKLDREVKDAAFFPYNRLPLIPFKSHREIINDLYADVS
jgi:mutator protein MutT